MTKARDLANGATALSAVSATELAYLDGVTSAVQTQIDGKQAVNAAVSTTELGYLDGVTSAIQTQLDAKTAKSTLTTTGDIYYASSANTPARLGIGSTGNVLTVASGIPSWAAPAAAGGMTLINTGGTTLTGSSVSISSIPASYKNLQVIVRNFKPSADGTNVNMRFNNDSNSNRYRLNSYTQWEGHEGSFNQNYLEWGGSADNGTDNGFMVFNIYDYANTTTWKFADSIVGVNHETNTSNVRFWRQCGMYSQTGAISEINFIPYSTGTFTSGTIFVYGVS